VRRNAFEQLSHEHILFDAVRRIVDVMIDHLRSVKPARALQGGIHGDVVDKYEEQHQRGQLCCQ
jgi:hypothetical protein